MSGASNGESFWDITTPAYAAEQLRAEHGANAVQAAEHCAAIADGDGGELDRQFWMAVVAELRATSHEPLAVDRQARAAVRARRLERKDSLQPRHDTLLPISHFVN